ncbi:MAG TPA: FtsX-like permease family protein [Anaerolineales bacterium]|nr:FtsX-like permease family protein [Anaerolineales bacterium]
MLSLRTLLRHPIQFAIMLLGIALGVAVMVSIDLANASAERAFDLSMTAVTGRATHAIVGSNQGVDESVYVSLRTDPQWRTAVESAPLVIAYAVSPQLGDIPFTVLGIDPFAEAPFRGYLGNGEGTRPETIAALMMSPNSVVLSASTAQRYGLQPCQRSEDPYVVSPTDACRITLSINGEPREVYLTGLLEPSDDFARRALETLILTDIATAQSLSNTNGHLTQIDLILPTEFDIASLSAVLPPGTLLIPSELRNDQVNEMTSAFRFNLTALSLLALLVGIFLIYNAMTFSVVQRRAVFGTLRSIGYTREQVFGMVVGEAALVGALGSGLGLALGILLGQGAVQMVSQTINDLYFAVSVRGVQIPVSSLLKGGVAGLTASIFAAAAPAWEAASIAPRLALSRVGLESKIESIVNRVAQIGVLIALVGVLILVIPTRDLVISFSGTFAVVMGLAALTPFVTITVMRLLSKPLARFFGLVGRLAPRNVIRSQSRTAVAVAALMIAVAVTIGVQVMISSFRTTVQIWLEQTMRGDIYISTQGLNATRLDTPLDPQIISLAQEYPEADSTIAIRVVTAESDHGPVELLAVHAQRPMDPRLFLASQGNPEQTQQMMEEGAILLSEPLANRLGISSADGSLALLTPNGWQSFPIAGIYSDYTSTRGTVRMDLDVYRRLWNDNDLNGVALILEPNANVDEVSADLRTRLTDFPNIQVNPSSALREEAMVVFDRTFAITTAMQLITTLVAFIGVLSSLLAMQIEKAREIGILRAIGLTLAEMRRLTLWETGLLGASAGLLALPTGYILAWILIFVINQRSFGWTLQMHLELAPFMQAFLLSVSAALLAGLYPAWRLSHMQVAEALRGE